MEASEPNMKAGNTPPHAGDTYNNACLLGTIFGGINRESTTILPISSDNNNVPAHSRDRGQRAKHKGGEVGGGRDSDGHAAQVEGFAEAQGDGCAAVLCCDLLHAAHQHEDVVHSYSQNNKRHQLHIQHAE